MGSFRRHSGGMKVCWDLKIGGIGTKAVLVEGLTLLEHRFDQLLIKALRRCSFLHSIIFVDHDVDMIKRIFFNLKRSIRKCNIIGIGAVRCGGWVLLEWEI